MQINNVKNSPYFRANNQINKDIATLDNERTRAWSTLKSPEDIATRLNEINFIERKISQANTVKAESFLTKLLKQIVK